MKKHFLLCALIMAVILCSGCAAVNIKGDSMLIKADDQTISYMGRIDFSDKKAPRFDWPGTSISFSFKNSKTCSVILEDGGGNDFNIIIDGKQAGILAAEKGEKEYLLAGGLDLKKHEVELTKRTETYDGATVFKGFILDKTADAIEAQKKKSVKIEFIGDSLSVGYGVEGKGINCAEDSSAEAKAKAERKYKNNYLAFSAVTARELGAEFNVIAISGRGVVRNYGEKEKASAEPLPIYYGRVLMNDAGKKWDFKSYVPDIVVINLGTNDFSTEPKPAKEAFISGYVKLIDKVRKNYPDAHIFICSGPTQSEPFYEAMNIMLKGLKDRKIHKVTMKPLTEKDWGCDYHPNTKAAKRMAGELVKQIKKVVVKTR